MFAPGAKHLFSNQGFSAGACAKAFALALVGKSYLRTCVLNASAVNVPGFVSWLDFSLTY